MIIWIQRDASAMLASIHFRYIEIPKEPPITPTDLKGHGHIYCGNLAHVSWFILIIIKWVPNRPLIGKRGRDARADCSLIYSGSPNGVSAERFSAPSGSMLFTMS